MGVASSEAEAKASAQVQFVYNVAQGRIVYVHAAYEQVLHGTVAGANAELLARLHPDNRAFLAHYRKLWQRGLPPDEAEIRLLSPGQPDQWFCLAPHYQQAPDGTVLLGGDLRDISVAKRYQQNADSFNTRKNAALEILSHDLRARLTRQP